MFTLKILIILFISKFCHSYKMLAPDPYYKQQTTDTNNEIKENIDILIIRLLNINFIFDFMYHYDNVGRDVVENAFHNVKPKNGSLFVGRIYYYENQTEPFLKTKAVNGYYLLHFIFLKNVTQFEELNRHYSIQDRAAIICIRNVGLCVDQYNSSDKMFKFEAIAKAKYLKTMHSLLVIEISDDELKLYEMCFYCGSYSLKPQLLVDGKLTGNTTMLLNDVIDVFLFKIWEPFTNLKGHNFRVGIPLKDTFFNCEVQNITQIGDFKIVECSKLSGQEAEILKILSVSMNFTYTLITFDEFNAVLRSVSNESLDWAVGSITMTPERWNISLFSLPIQEDPLKVIYSVKQASYIVQVLQLLKVFPLKVWLLLTLVILMQSFAIYLVKRFRIGSNERVSLSVVAWVIGFYLIDQPLTKKMIRACQWAVVIWLMSSICIGTIYKAHLTSVKMTPESENVKNLETLMEEGYKGLLVQKESEFVLDTIRYSKDQYLKKLSKVLSVEKSICATLKKLTQDKYFLIIEMFTLKYSINENCTEELSKEDILSYKFSPDEIFISLHAWPLRFDSPFIYHLNLMLLYISECGLNSKLAEDVLYPHYQQLVYYDGEKIVDSEEYKGDKSFYGYLMFWGVGITMAIICFLFELAYKRYQIKTSKV